MSVLKAIREMNDDDAAIRAWNDFKKAETERLDAFERFERYLNIYMALDPPDMQDLESRGLIDDDDSTQSNTYLSIGAAAVDAFVAQCNKLMFGTDDYMEIAASDWEDEPFVYPITAHLKKRHKEMKFHRTMMRVLQDAACFDYGVTMTRWLMRPGYVPRRKHTPTVKQYGQIKLEYDEVTMVEDWLPNAIDRSDVTLLNYRRCFHDPEAILGLEDSRFFCYQYDIKIEDLIAEAKTNDKPWGKWKNVDKVLKTLKEQGYSNAEGELEFNEPDGFEIDQTDLDVQPFKRKLTVLCYLTGDHSVEMIFGIVVRRRNLSGWPIQIWKVFDVPGVFRGMGILQRMERNQYDINASLNSRRDFQNLVVDPIAAVSKSLLSADGEPDLYPGKVFVAEPGIPVQDQLYIYTPGVNINQDAMGDLQLQINMVQKIAGASENTMGSFSAGRKTARETSEVAAGVADKTLYHAERFEKECLVPIYMEQFKLEQFHMTGEDRFKYHGKMGDRLVVIRPEDYRWNAMPEFQARGTIEMLGKPVEVQQFFTALQMAASIPQINERSNWDALVPELYRILTPKHYHKFTQDPRIGTTNVPPDVENFLAAQGREIEISPSNNHQEHIASHTKLLQTVDYMIWPDHLKQKMQAHIEQHKQIAQQAQGGPNQMLSMQDASDQDRGVRGPQLPGVG